SYPLWAEIGAEVGRTLYHPNGIVYCTPPGSDLLRGILESARLHAIPVEQLSTLPAGLAMPDGFVAHFEPEAGWLEVESCVRAQAELAVRHGARIVTGERALSWSAGAAGVEVVTDRGVHRAAKLVIAGGAW